MSLCPGDIHQLRVLEGQPAFNIFLQLRYKVDTSHRLMENWFCMWSGKKCQRGKEMEEEEKEPGGGTFHMYPGPHCHQPDPKFYTPQTEEDTYNCHRSQHKSLYSHGK